MKIISERGMLDLKDGALFHSEFAIPDWIMKPLQLTTDWLPAAPSGFFLIPVFIFF